MAKKYATDFPAATQANLTDHLQLVQASVDKDGTLNQLYELFVAQQPNGYLDYIDDEPCVLDIIPPAFIYFHPSTEQPLYLPELGVTGSMRPGQQFEFFNSTGYVIPVKYSDGTDFITINLGYTVIFRVSANGTSWEYKEVVTSVNGFAGVVNLDTTFVLEGTRLYFTNARADARIAGYLQPIDNTILGDFTINTSHLNKIIGVNNSTITIPDSISFQPGFSVAYKSVNSSLCQFVAASGVTVLSEFDALKFVDKSLVIATKLDASTWSLDGGLKV